MELSIKLYATKSGWSIIYIVTQVIVSNSFSEDRQNVWSDLNANQLTKAHSDDIAERMFLKNLILKKKLPDFDNKKHVINYPANKELKYRNVIIVEWV